MVVEKNKQKLFPPRPAYMPVAGNCIKCQTTACWVKQAACRAQGGTLQGARRAQGLYRTSVPVLKAYGCGGWWRGANHPLMSRHGLQDLSPISVDGGDVMDLRPLQDARSCVVGLTTRQNPVNTCPSDATGMDGHVQWE